MQWVPLVRADSPMTGAKRGAQPTALLLAALTLGAFGCAEGGDALDGVGGSAGAQGLGGSAGAPGSGGAETAPAACSAPAGVFAVSVLDHAFGSGQDVGQDQFPELVLGPPQGAGKTAGSTSQVVSLGDGGFVEIGFGEHGIVDGAGADFIVFENAFLVSGDLENPYAELGTVSVSQDGVAWVAFPCTAREYPYGSCAGWHPVLANAESNQLDPTDAEVAGGDPFDLAEVDLPWVRYVRIEDVRDDQQLTFDLDAVALVHPGCFE
jgi:hypothetical protein